MWLKTDELVLWVGSDLFIRAAEFYTGQN